jgi:hypothetical protein
MRMQIEETRLARTGAAPQKPPFWIAGIQELLACPSNFATQAIPQHTPMEISVLSFQSPVLSKEKCQAEMPRAPDAMGGSKRPERSLATRET